MIMPEICQNYIFNIKGHGKFQSNMYVVFLPPTTTATNFLLLNTTHISHVKNFLVSFTLAFKF